MLLEVKNLSVEYRIGEKRLSAVDDVSFSIEEGQVFVLVGESGCGKSTVASAVARLLLDGNEEVSGEILFDGVEITGLPEKEMEKLRGREIGMVFQNPLNALNPVYKVGYQVEEPFVINDRMPKNEAREIALRSFKAVGIPNAERRLDSFPHEMSGGQLQRVVISISTAQRPKLLIADEPTTALDVTIEGQILKLIRDSKTKEDKKAGILLITHNFGTVAEIADRVGVMYAGHMVEIADVYEIFENPQHIYTKLLLQSLPTIKKSEGRLKTIDGVVPRFYKKSSGCRFASRCPMAEERCFNQRPEMTQVRPGHLCACHLVKGQE